MISSQPSVNIGEAKISTRVTVGEPFMVKAHEMQDRRVPIVDMTLLLDRFVAMFICRTVTVATL